MIIKRDEYETVLNDPGTYDVLARYLRNQPVVIAWTDEEGTQLDILLVLKPLQFGPLQRGMSGRTDLFVAVSNCGMFGFEVNDKWKAPGYIGSKLGLGGNGNDTEVALADLLNGIIKELIK